MADLKVKLKTFQDDFLFSQKRFPLLKASIGTGKTMMLLLKVWNYCELYPNSLALLVRKEFTDLRDSTMKDFERYFGVKADSNKEYRFNNGSVIMFRHASEINVLKNVNLSIVGIEQAEEFETEETFVFLRDRLRRENAPYRQLCLIANANGHNWIWRMWKNKPSSEEYVFWEANTFDNEDNLPADFIADLRAMEYDAPSHYRRYVLNSDEETDSDDYLMTLQDVLKSIKYDNFKYLDGPARIVGIDVARFGDDETCFTILEQKQGRKWDQIYIETVKEKPTTWVAGRALALKREFGTHLFAIDDIGVGGGVTDILNESIGGVKAFISNAKAKDEENYADKGAESAFNVKQMIEHGRLRLLDDDIQTDEIMTIRFKYMGNGKKRMISKDDMRKDGIKSPNIFDSLKIACYYVDIAVRRKANQGRQFQVTAPKRY